ncbi:SH3 domain-containing protein [Novosphingobium sp. KCTC 2891]|uniref:SH3 domain-containing protein n=1 Tax=Novosphingobium sp. KCTC 2891 TaxID=2989730 RepID=UPI0022214A78|nr:SH3 domain-containing protein [Novosphingobium sp. KCTC 2891]MCW1381725.1 SH3 domain-containing protein [Novosphingobium sp. KCTC 2891]
MPKGKSVLSLVLAAALAATGAPVRAADDAGVPYWVSLRKEQSNMRVGPGREYRISWVYVRQGLPMKVLRVMGGWRLVEDPAGVRGWMLAQFLTRTHTGMVKGGEAPIRENKDGSGRLLWRAAPGVVAKLDDCDEGWCKADIDGRKGYIEAAKVWGAGTP